MAMSRQNMPMCQVSLSIVMMVMLPLIRMLRRSFTMMSIKIVSRKTNMMPMVMAILAHMVEQAEQVPLEL